MSAASPLPEHAHHSRRTTRFGARALRNLRTITASALVHDGCGRVYRQAGRKRPAEEESERSHCKNETSRRTVRVSQHTRTETETERERDRDRDICSSRLVS